MYLVISANCSSWMLKHVRYKDELLAHGRGRVEQLQMLRPSSLRRSIQIWEEQILKVIILIWFNRQKNQCCQPMAQNLRISTQLLVILLSSLHRSHKKGNHFGIYAMCLSPNTLWVSRNIDQVCWGENLDGHRQNPPEKIQVKCFPWREDTRWNYDLTANFKEEVDQ